MRKLTALSAAVAAMVAATTVIGPTAAEPIEELPGGGTVTMTVADFRWPAATGTACPSHPVTVTVAANDDSGYQYYIATDFQLLQIEPRRHFGDLYWPDVRHYQSESYSVDINLCGARDRLGLYKLDASLFMKPPDDVDEFSYDTLFETTFNVRRALPAASHVHRDSMTMRHGQWSLKTRLLCLPEHCIDSGVSSEKVLLQRRTGGSWVTVQTGVTNLRGYARLATDRPGRYRLHYAGNRHYTMSLDADTSRTFLVR